FEQLVEALQPERSGAHGPLFQVVFSFESGAERELEWGGLQWQVAEVANQTAKFDLTLMMRESAGGLKAEFEYRRELFDEASIARMAGHFAELLQGVVADAGQKVSQLPLLTAVEEQQLQQWRETQTTYPRQRSVSELFEEQAAQTPDAIALVYGAEQLSYGELNRRANQLGHYLRAAGVGAEGRVGILMERSLEVVIALLGTLKAGGTYVPLDPS